MPPKKEQHEEKKNRLGRPSNTLKMGIVGMANVGIAYCNIRKIYHI